MQDPSSCHAPVSSIIVGDNHTVTVPAAVLRRRRQTVVLHQSNVAFHQLAEIARRHLERVLVTPVNRIISPISCTAVTTLQRSRDLLAGFDVAASWQREKGKEKKREERN